MEEKVNWYMLWKGKLAYLLLIQLLNLRALLYIYLNFKISSTPFNANTR